MLLKGRRRCNPRISVHTTLRAAADVNWVSRREKWRPTSDATVCLQGSHPFIAKCTKERVLVLLATSPHDWRLPGLPFVAHQTWLPRGGQKPCTVKTWRDPDPTWYRAVRMVYLISNSVSNSEIWLRAPSSVKHALVKASSRRPSCFAAISNYHMGCHFIVKM